MKLTPERLCFLLVGILVVAYTGYVVYLFRYREPERTHYKDVVLTPYTHKEIGSVADASLEERTNQIINQIKNEPANHRFNDFAFDLYRESVKNTDGNLFISPLSIGELFNGSAFEAQGDTQKQLLKILRFRNIADCLAFARIVQAIRLSTDNPDSVQVQLGRDDLSFQWVNQRMVSMKLTLDLWGSDSISWNKQRLSALSDLFGLNFQPLDFTLPKAKICDTINQHISRSTDGFITDLVSTKDIDSRANGILTNAAVFKGSWLACFPEKNTKPRPFTLESGVIIEVPTMSYFENFNRGFYDEAWILSYDYIDQHYTMFFILPPEGISLTTLEKSVTNENLIRWIRDMSSEYCNVQIPKFKIETSIDMTQPLETLGDAPLPTLDFPDLIKDQSTSFAILPAAVNHQAFVEIDEKGTVAAAASFYGTVGFGDEPNDFIANRPFLFMIYEKTTNTILFIGRVKNPCENIAINQ